MLAAPFATTVVGSTLQLVGYLFLLVLLVRLVFDYVQLFVRDFAPRGVLLVVVEIVYTISDPPLKLLRRFIPPIRLGSVALDVSFMLLMILVLVFINVVARL